MMTAAEISSGLADHAHRYAMTHADSALRPCSAIKEEMSGIAQVCGSINVQPKTVCLVRYVKTVLCHNIIAYI